MVIEGSNRIVLGGRWRSRMGRDRFSSRRIETHPLGGTGQKSLRVAPLLVGLGCDQGIHEAQVCKSIAAIDDLTSINGPAVPVHKPGCKGRTSENHGHRDTGLVKSFEIVLHEGGRFDQQTAHGNAIGLVLVLGLNDRFAALLDAEVDHLITIIREDDINEIFANIMHISFDGRN